MNNKQVIIDVREPFEYESGHVEGALNIPLAELLSGAPELDNLAKDTDLTVYCMTGSRASMAIQVLGQMGFTNLTNGINVENIENNR